MFQQCGSAMGDDAGLSNSDHRKPAPIQPRLKGQPIQQTANIKNPLAQKRPAQPQGMFGTVVVRRAGNGVILRLRFSGCPKIGCQKRMVSASKTSASGWARE